MTALPIPPPEPGFGYTVAEYAALGDDDRYRPLELQEGNLAMTPSAMPRHSRASRILANQLDAQLPADVVVLQDVDVDLELAPPDCPGTVRRPDVVVVDRGEYDRVDANGGILRASGVRLVVEIVSPGSQRTDRIIKRAEYADAGIPCYWILDLDPPVSLVAYRQGGELGYVDDGDAAGRFSTSEPYPLTVELDRLG